MEFELTNDQRSYFGLEPIEKQGDKVALKEIVTGRVAGFTSMER